MNFSFCAAASLYQQARHPRLYFGADDILQIRNATDPACLTCMLMKRLRQKADIIMAVYGDIADNLPYELGNWSKTWDRPGTLIIRNLADLAMVAAIDENEAMIAAVRTVLDLCAKAEEHQGTGRKRFGPSAGRPLAIAFDLVYPHLSATQVTTFCKWVCESTIKNTLESLLPAYYLNAGQNIPMTLMINAATAALALKGEAGCEIVEETRPEFLRMFKSSASAAVGRNGYPSEDIGYGTIMAARLILLGEAYRRAGIFDYHEHCPHLLKFPQAMLHFTQPWGSSLSNTGDHGDDFGERELPLTTIAEALNNDNYLWLLKTLHYHKPLKTQDDNKSAFAEMPLDDHTQIPITIFSLPLTTMEARLHKASKPADDDATSFVDPDRGIVSFRSSWQDDATLVVFDGSERPQAAKGHAHASCGHFSLTALGEYFSIDTGRYNNEQDCHSVVLIEGKSGRSTHGEWQAVKHPGILKSHHPGCFVDTAMVDSSLQHDCYYARRQLGLVKHTNAPSYVFTVDMINSCDDWANYVWQLQTSPENTIEPGEGKATITGCRQGNMLDIHFFLPSASDYPRPHELLGIHQQTGTPSSYKYIPNPEERALEFSRPAEMVHSRAYVRPKLCAKFAGFNGNILAVMVPRPEGHEPATVHRLDSCPGTIALSIEFAGIRDTLIHAFESFVLDADSVSGTGRWCVISRNGSSGEVIDFAAEACDTLMVDGSVLL